MGIIFHIDVNSAFLSWSALEQLENGSAVDLRTIPSIVGGDMAKRHGVVLAKSIPAKAYGITTGEPVVNAFRKYPGLTMVAPNHSMYKQRSHELMTYLSGLCPCIEQASIDECYMDYTPIAANYHSPEAAAAYIKDTVYENFGFTVNVGISDKKVLAKMASDFKKPNLVHTLYSREISKKLWPLPVSSLFLCGHSSAETLHNLGILSIGDLARTDPAILEAHLKSHGLTLWNYANGNDNSAVESVPARAKGVGNSITMKEDAVSREQACIFLRRLSESVGKRLRAQCSLAGMISTEIKYASFKSVSHQTILDAATDSADTIYQTACLLFDELWNGEPIRLLGIRTSKLSAKMEPVQINLFDYQATAPDRKKSSEKQQRLDAALDSLRKKYGKEVVKKGSLSDSPQIS